MMGSFLKRKPQLNETLCKVDYVKRLKKNIGYRFRKGDSDLYNDFCTLFEPLQFDCLSQVECNQAI